MLSRIAVILSLLAAGSASLNAQTATPTPTPPVVAPSTLSRPARQRATARPLSDAPTGITDRGIQMAPSGHFYAADGARVNRINDRLLVGGAYLSEGNANNASTANWLEWMATEPINGGDAIYSNGTGAQLYVLTDEVSPDSQWAGFFGAQSALKTDVNRDTGSIYAVTVNNNASIASRGWAAYLEAVKTSPESGITGALELEARDSSGAPGKVLDPYSSYDSKMTYGLAVGAGAGAKAAGQSHIAVGQVFFNNTVPFNSGLIYSNGSVAPSGPGGITPAIALPKNYRIVWYSGPGAVGGSLNVNDQSDMHLAAKSVAIDSRLVVTNAPALATANEGVIEGAGSIVNKADSISGLRVRPTFTGTGSGGMGVDVFPTFAPSTNINDALGGAIGASFQPHTGSAISSANGLRAVIGYGNSGGAVTTGTTLRVDTPIPGSSVPPTQYGLRIQNQGLSGSVNNYALYVDAQSGATNNYAGIFAGGNVGIGTVAPGARLQVAGGDVAVTTPGNGLVLRATDGGGCFRITVNSAGVLSTSAVSCP